MTELHELSLSAVCRDMKSGARSCVAVTTSMLDRIAQLAHLNAFASLRSDAAISHAERLDAQRAAGEPLGALFGVPIALKDLVFLEGEVTASGTRVMADFRPNFSATIANRLMRAGAVVLGKTQLTEGAYGVHHPENLPPQNPWSAQHWTGVSSSGSGVAVAARLAFAALGSDTGGSIRFPSACCGVVGFKPTYGRVSRHGVFPLAGSLDHIGPMTRCVEDAARMLSVLAGPDPADPSSAAVELPNLVRACELPVEGLRLGIDRRYVTEGVHEDVVAAVDEALEAFRGLGVEVVEFTMPASTLTLVEGWAATCATECAAAHAELYPAQAERYGPVLAELLDFGATVSPEVTARLELTRAVFQRELEADFARFDALICPAMPLPVPLTAVIEDVNAPREQQASTLQFTAPFNYSGHPTLTLPIGLDQAGLPRAVQLVGPLFGEANITTFAAALEWCQHTSLYPKL